MLARVAVVAENDKVPDVHAEIGCRQASLGCRHRLPRLKRDDAAVERKAPQGSNICLRYVTDWGVAEVRARVCQCLPEAPGQIRRCGKRPVRSGTSIRAAQKKTARIPPCHFAFQRLTCAPS
jgi:hypothetical protein